MTTTELIDVLQRLEKGVSGRSREISFYIGEGCEAQFIPSPKIEVNGTGDGVAGAEITLRLIDA